MSDSYQAIYDAVRSKISGADAGSILADAAREAFDFSHMKAIIQQEFCIAAAEIARPSVLMRPTLDRTKDEKFVAYYGAEFRPHSTVYGFGDSPSEAMMAFDIAWTAKRA